MTRGVLLHFGKIFSLVTVVASESFPADPASDLDQFQSMPINSLRCCLHTSTPPPLSHDFSAAARPQCSRQRQRHSTDWCRCAGATGCRLKAPARHARESSRRGVDCAACSPVLFKLTSEFYIMPMYCWCPAQTAITTPTHPALPQLCGIQS